MKIGRNDPCPCGSGLKYKHCHYDEAARVGIDDSPNNDYLRRLLERIDGIKVKAAELAGHIDQRFQNRPALVLSDILRDMEFGRDALYSGLTKMIAAENMQLVPKWGSEMQDALTNGFCALDLAAEHMLEQLQKESSRP